MSRNVLITLVSEADEVSRTRLMLASLRHFGGPLAGIPAWIFTPDRVELHLDELRSENNWIVRFSIPRTVGEYLFGAKVAACAEAEKLAGDSVETLIWMDPGCLVISPPDLFLLEDGKAAALRPVHVRNVGIRAGKEPDGFWRGIFHQLNTAPPDAEVLTFVEDEGILPYFNTHCFSIDPSLGIMRQWLIHFTELVNDDEFQESHCRDALHRIFLHQAVFSGIMCGSIGLDKCRLLPPTYSYPYNLQSRIPPERKSDVLNDLVCIAYEKRCLDPESVNDIAVREPLRSWLAGNYSC
jgi:hypothetical protein